MRSLAMIAKAALLSAILAAPAAAAVVVPGSGTTNYFFQWAGGMGPIDRIDGVDQSEWSLTLVQPSTVTITATDGFIVGDVFSLIFGGVSTPWTSVGSSVGFFQGIFTAPLAAGSYLFSLNVSNLANGYDTGGGYASFAVRPSVVPLPAGGLLLISALGLLAAARRRMRA